jgi:hypothetical protein
MIFIFTLMFHVISIISIYHPWILKPLSFVWLLLQPPKKVSSFQVPKCCICFNLFMFLSLQNLVHVKAIWISNAQLECDCHLWHLECMEFHASFQNE